MRTIRGRLMIVFTVVILVVTAGLGIISVGIISNILLEDANDDLQALAEAQAKYIQTIRDVELRYLDGVAHNSIIFDDNVPLQEKISFLEGEAHRTGYETFVYANRDGDSFEFNTGMVRSNVSDAPYFQRALKGEANASDVMISRITGQPVVVFAVPIYRNGQQDGVFFGVREGTVLSQVVSEIEFRKTGYAYLINDQGTTIGHKNIDLVLRQDNDIENAKADSSLRQIVDLTRDHILQRKVGSGKYVYEGKEQIVAFAPVEGSPWIVVVGVEAFEIMAEVHAPRNLLIGLILGAIVIGALVTAFLSNSIAKPIISITSIVERVAGLDLVYDENHEAVNYLKRKDEVGQVTRAVVDMQTNLMEVVISLQEVAKNVAYTSENLSAASEENAATIEEVASSISSFSQTVDQTRQRAEVMMEDAVSIETLAEEGSNQMNVSMTSMGQIETAGREVKASLVELSMQAKNMENILKIISDIADQTNLLALNAAIEAARAGEHGRGFAVVADEVRNLAEQTQQSVGDITGMIDQLVENAVKSTRIMDEADSQIQGGTKLLAQTQKGLEAITNKVNDTVKKIQEITHSIQSLNETSDTIAAASQEQAASMEEVASTTETLAHMGEELQSVVAQFKV